MRPLLALAAVAALAIGTPTVAYADEAPASFTFAQQQEAEGRWKEGRALYEEGKVDEARLKYAQAFAVLQRTNILWNLAIAEFYSNRPLDALHHFKQFVQRSDAEPADVQRARDKYIPEASKLTAHIAVEAGPGLEVAVDDQVQPGATPLRDTIDVNPGPHRVQARHHGQMETQEVTCAAGQTVTVPIALRAGRETLVPVYPRTRAWVTVALAVGAAAATAGGAVFAMDSRTRDEDNRAFAATSPAVCADRGSLACGNWQDRLDAQQQSATMAKLFYVAGGVLAAGAVVTWLAWPKPRAESAAPVASRLLVAPSVTAGGGGVHVGGTF